MGEVFSPEQPIGSVLHCSSDPDGGSDVGVLWRVSEGEFVWCGEITRREAEEFGVEDNGWHLVRHVGGARHHIASEVCQYNAVDLITALARLSPTPHHKEPPHN